MDQPSPAPENRLVPPSANGKRPIDPDALPPSAARRAQLLLMLIILPVVAVSLPAIFVTMIFGQHPKPKTLPPAKPAKPVVAPTQPVKPAAAPTGHWYSNFAKLIFSAPKLPVVAPARPPTANDTAGLHEALQRSADTLLPTPSTLTGEPVRLTCRPERLAARSERVVKQAEAFGGTANEWLAEDGEKHFYVELPPSQAEAFRRSLMGDPTPAPPLLTASPAASPETTAARDQVEVFIHANSDE